MKKLSCIILTLLMLFSLAAGCNSGQGSADTPTTAATTTGGSAQTTQPPTTAVVDANYTVEPGVLTVAISAEGRTLNPADYNDQGSGNMTRQIHEPLAYQDPETGELVPMLAESWEFVGEKTIRIHVRQGVTAHNGSTFTANDIAFTIRTGMASTYAGYYWAKFDPESITVVDEYTFEISTLKPSMSAMNYLLGASPTFLSEAAFDEAGGLEGYARNAIGGTGPWKFSEWIAGDRIVYERNEDYWGEKPAFEKLVLRFMTDSTARALAIESGDVDAVWSVASADIGTLENVPGVDVVRVFNSGVNYIFLNTQDEFLSNPKVRQALRYALDLDNMVRIAWGNVGAVADSVFSASSPHYASPATQYGYDVDKAKALMEEAGYGAGIELKVVVNENSARMSMAEMMKNTWSAIGVELTIEVLELTTILQLITDKEYQITLLATGGVDGDEYYNMFHSAGGTANRTYYSNSEVDQLFDLAQVEKDETLRKQYYNEIAEILITELPMIPLQFDEQVNAIRDTLEFTKLEAQVMQNFCHIRPKS